MAHSVSNPLKDPTILYEYPNLPRFYTRYSGIKNVVRKSRSLDLEPFRKNPSQRDARQWLRDARPALAALEAEAEKTEQDVEEYFNTGVELNKLATKNRDKIERRKIDIKGQQQMNAGLKERNAAKVENAITALLSVVSQEEIIAIVKTKDHSGIQSSGIENAPRLTSIPPQLIAAFKTHVPEVAAVEQWTIGEVEKLIAKLGAESKKPTIRVDFQASRESSLAPSAIIFSPRKNPPVPTFEDGSSDIHNLQIESEEDVKAELLALREKYLKLVSTTINKTIFGHDLNAEMLDELTQALRDSNPENQLRFLPRFQPIHAIVLADDFIGIPSKPSISNGRLPVYLASLNNEFSKAVDCISASIRANIESQVVWVSTILDQVIASRYGQRLENIQLLYNWLFGVIELVPTGLARPVLFMIVAKLTESTVDLPEQNLWHVLCQKITTAVYGRSDEWDLLDYVAFVWLLSRGKEDVELEGFIKDQDLSLIEQTIHDLRFSTPLNFVNLLQKPEVMKLSEALNSTLFSLPSADVVCSAEIVCMRTGYHRPDSSALYEYIWTAIDDVVVFSDGGFEFDVHQSERGEPGELRVRAKGTEIWVPMEEEDSAYFEKYHSALLDGAIEEFADKNGLPE